MNLSEWAARWGHMLPPEAQAEFNALTMPWQFVEREPQDKSESAVQADIRLAASREFRAPLWRNNNGAATMIDEQDPDGTGRYVRFGLGNDSAKLNKAWKSSDLIGITPVQILPHHVGRTFGVFTAVEVKKPDWHLVPSDKRGHAQQNFMNSVASFGGFAGFAQSVDDMRRIVTQ